MSWATSDLREEILVAFSEVQAPWQSALVNQVIRLVGCQSLQDTAAKLRWAANNKDKQREYSRRWEANNQRQRRKGAACKP